MRKHNHRLFPLIFLLFSMMILTATTSFYLKDHLIFSYAKEKLIPGDIKYIYRTFISPIPYLNEQAFGGQDSPIMMIAYLDYKSESSKYFSNKILPSIYEDYISTGKIRYYQKQHITYWEYSENGEKFKYVNSLACLQQLGNNDIIESLMVESAEEFSELAKTYNVQGFESCIESESDEVKETMLDVELLGMKGHSPRFYIGFSPSDSTAIDGVPSYERFARKIRNYQLIVGD